MKPLKNRQEAGNLLAERLKSLDLKNACILALPRGGVPVAWEISQALNLPLDILLVKKIGAPNQPEFAIGAVSEDRLPIWNQEVISLLGLQKNQLRDLARQTREKIVEQANLWRKGKPALEVKDKTAVVVDDGLATGLTMLAAVEFLKRRKAARIIVAAPVGSSTAAQALGAMADEVIVLQIPEPFFSVGQWYEDFTQVTDEMVTRLLSGEMRNGENSNTVRIPAGSVELVGDLIVPPHPQGVILFAHGSGSTRNSPRNRYVSTALNRSGFATLLFDLLTQEEAENRANVFDISLLSQRLLAATKWVRNYTTLKHLPIGYFGASTGAAAALVAASQDSLIASVVSRGGRPDLAEPHLEKVQCPVLLIVGAEDHGVIELNEKAKASLKNAEMVLVPGAGHLFEEAGALDEVVEYSGDWFEKTLTSNVEVLKITPRESICDDIKKLAKSVSDGHGWDHLVNRLGKAKIVMLGEATHGTQEFYELRKIISQQLIEKYGYNFIAVEGDWPDCYKLNQYLHQSGQDSVRAIMDSFHRWPTWLWANEVIADLLEWMRGKNVGFYGLDVYSLYESVDMIKNYAKKLKPSLEKSLLEAYSCLDSFERDEIEYSKAIARWPRGCEKEILQGLREILRLRLEETALTERELFDIRQNAKIVRNAEKYYRSMIFGGAESWNIRDEHMVKPWKVS